MKYKHYAPKADMVIVDGEKENVVEKAQDKADAAQGVWFGETH